jgi:hypothetical protein
MLGFARLSGAALIDIKRRPASQIRDRRRVWAAAAAFISSAEALAISYFVFGATRRLWLDYPPPGRKVCWYLRRQP